MATARPTTASDRKESAARTIAQSFCLIFGATLVAVGVLGFIFGGTDFNTGTNVQGKEFIIFEVNGWHNIVHIVSGLLLLAVAPNAKAAATGALAFGIAYLGVTVWGFIDGNDVFNLIPVNTADNVLHAALTGAALFAAFASGALGASARKDDHDRIGRHERPAAATPAERERTVR